MTKAKPKVRRRLTTPTLPPRGKNKFPDPPFVAEPLDDGMLDWLAGACDSSQFVSTAVACGDISLNIDPRTSEGRSVRRLIATIEKFRPRALMLQGCAKCGDKDHEAKDCAVYPSREAEMRSLADIAGASAAMSNDQLYEAAVALVVKEQKASTSFIQRRFQIGYNRAATMLDRMVVEKVVTAPDSTGKRTILSSHHDISTKREGGGRATKPATRKR